MRVMIVEDQTMIRSLLESYFRAEDGYRITASIFSFLVVYFLTSSTPPPENLLNL